jgi:serine acetyltransferase
VLGELRNRRVGDALAIGALAIVTLSILALAVAAFL